MEGERVVFSTNSEHWSNWTSLGEKKKKNLYLSLKSYMLFKKLTQIMDLNIKY